jgi:hypothetical protein
MAAKTGRIWAMDLGNDSLKALHLSTERGVVEVIGFDNIPHGNCVLPDDYITYTIFYDANGYSDSNVMIVDHLPQEVDYNSSSPLGDYNAFE